MNSVFSKHIRKFRHEVHWSQSKFAVALGVSQGLVSLWELGYLKPTADQSTEIDRVMKIVRDAEHAANQARQNVLNTLR